LEPGTYPDLALRVLDGKYRRTFLQSTSSKTVRPTAHRFREATFKLQKRFVLLLKTVN
jgi:16S rRNA G966 N2-methylase RsmD